MPSNVCEIQTVARRTWSSPVLIPVLRYYQSWSNNSETEFELASGKAVGGQQGSSIVDLVSFITMVPYKASESSPWIKLEINIVIRTCPHWQDPTIIEQRPKGISLMPLWAQQLPPKGYMEKS